MNYTDLSKKLKVIADSRRLEIINLLSCGELCGCDLLEHFSITQPTLSHHMKVLEEQGLVDKRKEGTKTIYQLNHDNLNQLKEDLSLITSSSTECLCHSIDGETSC